MTEQPTIPTSDNTEQPLAEPDKNQPLLNFLAGAFLGSLPAFVCLDMSSYMTHTSWLDHEVWKLAIAASIPLASGVLGIALKGKFLKALGDVMSSTSL